MLTSTFTALLHLRQAYGQQRAVALLEAASAFGLLPFVSSAPRLDGVRVLVVLLLALYAARKIFRCIRAAEAVRQLHLEERFLRHSTDPGRLARFLRHQDHLWTNSRLLHGLRILLMHPMAAPPRTEAQRRRTRRQFDRMLARYRPGRPIIDLVLLLLIGSVLGLAPVVRFPSDALLVQSGVAAAVAAIGGGLAHLVIALRIERALERFVNEVSEWSMSDPIWTLQERPRRAGYAHTLVYRSPSWFSAPPAATGRRSRRKRKRGDPGSSGIAP